MKYFDWNEEKNQKLKRERNISFEEIANYLHEEKFLDKIDNPNKKNIQINLFLLLNMKIMFI